MEYQTYKEVLKDLGYKLIDNGNHWRTSAKYRDGRNPTSIMIYKNTGVWRDYGVDSTSSFPFKRLVELTTGQTEFETGSLPFSEGGYKEEIELMDKVYPKSYLENLFPNYHFYEKRNISDETQKLYKCGLASSGKMYRRVTFPILNEADQIIGWSGRTIDDKPNIPKWKHLGKKRNWLYPYYLGESFQKAVEDSHDIFLVESIGDSLALTECGSLNHFVLFGVSMSSKLLSKLVELNPKRIIIALNNDSNKEYNTGLVNAVKIYLNLLSFFAEDKLEIFFPTFNDFGEWNETCQESFKLIMAQPMAFSTDIALEKCLELCDSGEKLLSQLHEKQLRRLLNER